MSTFSTSSTSISSDTCPMQTYATRPSRILPKYPINANLFPLPNHLVAEKKAEKQKLLKVRDIYFWHFSTNHHFYRFLLISSLATTTLFSSSRYICRAKQPKIHQLGKAAIVGGGQYIPPVCRYFRLSHKTISSQKCTLPHQRHCKYIIFLGHVCCNTLWRLKERSVNTLWPLILP